jgi:hypothetical protein
MNAAASRLDLRDISASPVSTLELFSFQLSVTSRTGLAES